MNRELSISKLAPPYQSMYYEALRKEGMQHIERLSSLIWTDYNVHDPGVTILETLCYAISDLGYRTNFSIEDLLTRGDGSLSNQFFTAAEILTNNPLTILDYRKLLIDIEGIRNAWLEIAPKGEIDIYANHKKSALDLDKPTDPSSPLHLNGLYRVLIDLDEEQAKLEETEIKAILKKAYRRLHAHRNLCEDFRCIDLVDEQDIRICLELEVENDAELETILGHIYFEFTRFLNPPIPFFSLEQMYEKGHSSEEIFQGMILDHGFIDEADLARSELRREIHASDLHRIIMKIEGVIGIKKLILFQYDKAGKLIEKDEWVLQLGAGRKPLWNEDASSITFFKDDIVPFKANKKEAQLIALALKEQARQIGGFPLERDIPIPKGSFVDLEDYTSILEHFPDTYGINPNGLPHNSSRLRQAQALQLKGYLAFFDQLLANYLSQLTQVKNLLGTEQSYDSTFFAHPLFELPNYEGLFESGITLADIKDRLEDVSSANVRTNRFLDHLLARFNESFSDYAVLMYQMRAGEDQPTAEELIEDKKNFLKALPALSRDRAKAYDYTRTTADGAFDIWDTDNVAGLKKRVAGLLGLEGVQRTSLQCAGAPPKASKAILVASPTLFDPLAKLYYQVSLYGADRKELLKTQTKISPEELDQHLLQLRKLMLVASNYRIVSPIKTPQFPTNKNSKIILPRRPSLPFRFLELLNDEGQVIARSALQKSEEEAEQLKTALITLLAEEIEELKQVIITSVPNPDAPPPYKLQMTIEDSEGNMLFQDEELYENTSSARNVAFDMLFDGTKDGVLTNETALGECMEDCSNEGFFVVEHLLLRPLNQQYQNEVSDPAKCNGLMPTDFGLDNCDCCAGLKDPYSFRMTVVLPAWPERFKDMSFRRYFERTLRLETPAHIAMKICWVNCRQLADFERKYKAWLREKTQAYQTFEDWIDETALDDLSTCSDQEEPQNPDPLAAITKQLICTLFSLKNVYPGARFHDCEADENGGGIILNHSTLG